MFLNDHKYRQEAAALSYTIATAHYPQHAAAAKQLVKDYLSRYDRIGLLIYTGEQADRDQRGYSIDMAHHMICSLLYEQDNGNSKVTEEVIDIQARLYLELPFAVIEGGQP